MPRYSAAQIYGFARRAGFSPDESATMTAIALAESGGNSRAHNPVGEDSRGLWQINARAHPSLASQHDLYDPLQNARAAYAVSRGGSDVSPWTVTHGGSGARYLRYRDDAQQAAIAFGDGPGHGVWTGTPGYGHPLSAGLNGGGLNVGGATPAADQAPGAGNPALDRFLGVARSQIGDPYIFGAEVKLDDPNPKAFDCSELTQWAAHQAGLTIPDGATAQFQFLKARGLVVPVEEGKKIPGALLFYFNSEPEVGGPRHTEGHVAISLGNGKTVEAQSSKVPIGEFNAGKRFRYAAVLPGISDGTAGTPPGFTLPPAPALTEPPPMGGPDADDDGLTDNLERRLGLDPSRGDTDGDNLADSYELITSKSDPRAADSDGDQLNDAFELARGLDPNSPDTDADGHLDGSFAINQADSDADGLDDLLEAAIGTNQGLADSDADGFSDLLEFQSHSDPMGVRSTPLDPAGDPLRHDPTSLH